MLLIAFTHSISFLHYFNVHIYRYIKPSGIFIESVWRIAFSKLYSKLYFDLFTLSRPITIQSHSLRLQVTDILFLSTFSAPPALPSPPPVVSRDPPSPPKEFSWVKCCFKCESGYEWYELGGKGKYST